MVIVLGVKAHCFLYILVANAKDSSRVRGRRVKTPARTVSGQPTDGEKGHSWARNRVNRPNTDGEWRGKWMKWRISRGSGFQGDARSRRTGLRSAGGYSAVEIVGERVLKRSDVKIPTGPSDGVAHSQLRANSGQDMSRPTRPCRVGAAQKLVCRE